jgi:hypothetical protein
VTANGTSTTTLTVTVEDANGNAVAGTAVTLSGSGSNNSFGAISGTTNASGVFTTTLASTLAQSETITATEGSVQEHTSVSFVPPVTGTVIESFGSTALVQVGGNYFLDPVSGGTGPELKQYHQPVTSGHGTAPIGAEQVSGGGYDVVWKTAGTNTFTVWSVDSQGNFNATIGNNLSGTSTALENFETIMHQDLNGDGVIGIPSATKPAPVSASQDNFQLASDANSGMSIQASKGQTGVVAITPHDTFVFAPNFGQVTITNFAPATDTIEFSKTVFANIKALLAATHDDASGNAVMTDAAHDTITLKQVTTAQVLAHQNDFHFI